MSIPGSSKSESEDNRSAFTPSSGHSEPEPMSRGLQSLDHLCSTTQDEINKQVAAQLHDVVTTTENLRDQLVTQTQANEQLKAELAAARAESTRSVAACDSKLGAVGDTVKMQTAAFAAQQDHVNNIDKATTLNLATLGEEVASLRHSSVSASNNGTTAGDASNAAVIAEARQDVQDPEQIRYNKAVTRNIFAASCPNIHFIIPMISAMVKGSKGGNARRVYEAGLSKFVDSLVELFLANGGSEAGGQHVKKELEDAMRFDLSNVRDFIEVIGKACGAPGWRGGDAETKQSVEVEARRVDELTTTTRNLQEQQEAVGVEFKTITILLKSEWAAAAEKLREEHTAAAEKASVAIAELRSELDATKQKHHEERTQQRKEPRPQ
ncbi:hypothetical protein LTR36_003248 [Oleoguttula mirabilis]|uniref:Uncharacterized protein n=1 Tax=Oleoguttula mirabilis TaxID=1507867 RepID=A0AAV9JYR3_9PEZI|nr:hypothetical protein LTR36_003248 [Oleoguttula mirabilis]